ncbi:MAG TPA: FtsW/RodA/SpoVE family cell cycle protein, partial [Polyangia bacterium]|nr:FtsW/RodA/SpoVE family cell cycle protein [Polyangia bacterium]
MRAARATRAARAPRADARRSQSVPMPEAEARRFPLWDALRARAATWRAAILRPLDGSPHIRPSEVGVDRVLVGTVLALLGFGMVMVFSSGAVFAAKKYGDGAYFLKRELIYAALGLVAMSFASRVDYSVYRRVAYPLLFISIVSLAVVLKMGSRAGGAIRWFRLGPLSFQPSELAKFAL